MPLKWVFAAVAVLALLAGTAMYLGTRVTVPLSGVDVAPAALFAATFRDTQGQARSLGEFQGKVTVLNFWATWCGPCREEMPAFTRLQSRWAQRGVQFVGISAEEPARVERFARDLAINYPLWVGGDEVGSLAKRLGNGLGVLPYTVLLDERGAVLARRVGPYTEGALDERLATIVAERRPKS